MSLFVLPGLANGCARSIPNRSIALLQARTRAASTLQLASRSSSPQQDATPLVQRSLRSDYFNAFSLSRSSLLPKSKSTFPINYFSHAFRTQAGPLRSATASLPISHEPLAAEHELPRKPTLTDPVVAYYLIGIATLVFAIVVIGGLTRLTESGLSITEWNLVTGTLPPLSEDAWVEELRKYRLSPEGRLLNKNITMSEFRDIYLMEWGHRLLGRVIGLAFLLPIPYFAYKRMLSRPTARTLGLIALLIGGQGALGWYMVKSGLTAEGIAAANPSGTPRVSQYRLAAHLGMAFAVYALTLRASLGILQDWKLAKLQKGVFGIKNVKEAVMMLHSKSAGRMRLLTAAMTGLVFLTAVSVLMTGAFVAGLDAGLLYNTFPYMGDSIVPPTSELYDPAYARQPDQSDLIRRNVFENPTTVQFDHRVLAMTTLTSAIALAVYAGRPHIRSGIPRQALRHVREIAAMACIQATLGISTLVYMVPTSLASLHQAGSLVLLTFSIMAVTSLRRPGYVAHVWLRRAGLLKNTSVKEKYGQQ